MAGFNRLRRATPVSESAVESAKAAHLVRREKSWSRFLKFMNKSATTSPPARGKPAATKAKPPGGAPKIDKSAARSPRTPDEHATNAPPTRRAFVPIVREFRGHTRKNEARLWIPIETNLIFRYEFAACSLQTRYIFVAIVLYCGGNRIEEIPLDAKFMASVLVADERTVEKSFGELLSKNLLQERKEREEKKKEAHTDRQEEIAPDARACVEPVNLFQDASGNENKGESGQLKIAVAAGANEGSKHSRFTPEECRRYAEACQSRGERIVSPNALAMHLYKTGEADAFILSTLYPERLAEIDAARLGAPVDFTDAPCAVCFGAKLADAGGKGFRKCEHCRDERGKATGYEPKGKTSAEAR